MEEGLKRFRSSLPRLRISKDKHYLETEEGTPFFWMADTAWTIAGHLKREEVEYYLDNRKEKGFNGIQIVALDPETNPEMRNAYGDKALVGDDVLKPNEPYWEYLDEIIARAARKGFYVLLLPAWGELIVGDDWFDGIFPKRITEENAEQYGYWIGRRYADYTNILWCLGGDRHPVHRGEDYRMVWRKLAQGIGQGATGKELKWDKTSKVWERILITYHPTISDDPDAFSSSFYFPEEPWMAFHMLQSGHREYVRNYAAIGAEYHKAGHKPIWDGEPNYEDWKITVIPGEKPRYHDAWNVRKRAYWSLMAGAFGHTYGNACVWCMTDEARKDGDVLTYTWKEALNRPGATQMQYLKRIMDTSNFFASEPCQEMLGRLDNYLDIRKTCRRTPDGRYAMIYFTSGGTEPVEFSFLSGTQIEARWYNPRDGKFYNLEGKESKTAQIIINRKQREYFSTPSEGRGMDWILILTAKEE